MKNVKHFLHLGCANGDPEIDLPAKESSENCHAMLEAPTFSIAVSAVTVARLAIA